MISPGTIELALGLVNAAIKLGRRIDTIQVQHTIGQGLPIKLPKISLDHASVIPEMKEFFGSERGKDVLADEDEGLRKAWKRYQNEIALAQPDPDTVADLSETLVDRFALLAGRRIPKIGEGLVLAPDPTRLLSVEYYIVESVKPGHQRSAVVDIALAMADVALEFVGNNPGLVTREATMQGVLSTFLLKFTKGDLEDLSYRQLFERTLSSVIATAIEKRELVEDVTGLSLFLEALDKARKDDPDFVAGLVAGQGFDKLLQSVLGTVSENLGRLTDDQAVVDIVGGILKDVSTDAVFAKVLKGEDDALAALAQVAIANVATYPALLEKVSGDELWHGVVRSVVAEVGASAKSSQLFSGEALGTLAQAALTAVAQDKSLLAGGFVERLVAAVAGALRTQSVEKRLSRGSLQAVAEAVLRAAAENIELVTDDKLLGAVLAAVMKEGAKGFKNGFNEKIAVDLAVAAVEAVGANAAAIDLPEEVAVIVGAVLEELSRDGLRDKLNRGEIVDIFRSALRVVAVNPHLWKKHVEGKLPAAVLRSIAVSVAGDPTKLLTGPVLGEMIIEVMEAVSRRANAYSRVTSGQSRELTKLLKETLKRLEGEVGIKLGAGNVVSVIVELVLDWGQDKFIVDADDAAFKTRVGTAVMMAA